MLQSAMATHCVELRAQGRTSEETLPWDAMHPNAWHRRARVVYDAPDFLVAAYRHLASKCFASLCPPATATGVLVAGDVGLGLALDDRRRPVLSIEAAALLQLVDSAGVAEPTPRAFEELQQSWVAGMCFFAYSDATGWRGCVAENRLWSAWQLRAGATIATPYPTPVARGWMPPCLLEDLERCVGRVKVQRVADAIAALGYQGAPDLVLWRPGELWMVEVKSATDRLRDAQIRAMQRLHEVGVRVQLCGPARLSLKRLAEAALQCEDTER